MKTIHRFILPATLSLILGGGGILLDASAGGAGNAGSPAVTVAAGATLDLGEMRPGAKMALSADSAGTLAATVPNPLAADPLIRADAVPAGASVKLYSRLGEEIPRGGYTLAAADGSLTYTPAAATAGLQPYSVELTDSAAWTEAGWTNAAGGAVAREDWARAGEVKATVSADGVVLTVDTDIAADTIEFLGEKPLTLKFLKNKRIVATVKNSTGRTVTADLSEWAFTADELGDAPAVTKPVIDGAAQGLSVAEGVPAAPEGWAVRVDTSDGIALVFENLAIDFTDPAKWKESTTFPSWARRDAPAAEPSYAFNDAFLQTLNGREATVVSVTNGSGNLWGVHSYNYATGNRSFDRDIFLDVRGGAFNIVSAGLNAGWDKNQPPNAPVTGRQLTQLSGTARTQHAAGAGTGGGRSPKLTGDAGVVVKDAAVVLGSVVGGWTTQHGTQVVTPEVTGDTVVRIMNVQSRTEGGSLNGSVPEEKLPAGLIVGGSIWTWNYGSSSLVGGNSSVIIEIPDTVTDATNFVKEIIGGSRSAPAGKDPWGSDYGGISHHTVNGDASVSISAPMNVVFTNLIHAGGVDPAPGGYGTLEVKGKATLTLNGGTYANILDGGVADGEKKIVFKGPVCFGGETAIAGFDAAEAGTGAELRVLPGARLSYGAALGAALPPFTLLGGTVTVDASFSAAEILAGRKICAGTLAGGLGAQDVRGHFSGAVSCPETGDQLPAAFTLEQGNRVMLSAGEPFVWNTTDGEWTETSFNNAQRAYTEDALLFFSDSTAGDGFVSVTNDGEKAARLLAFDNSAATRYALAGGRISVPEFRKTGLGSVTVAAPLTMTGGRIFIGGDTHVGLTDVGGTANEITFTDRSGSTPSSGAEASWGNAEVNLGTNDFTLAGSVSIGQGQAFALSSASLSRTFSRPVFIGNWSAFFPTAYRADGTFTFTGGISSKEGNNGTYDRVDKYGPGTVRFDCDTSFHGTLIVYEGKMVVNGALRNCAATDNEPIQVKPGAAIRFEGPVYPAPDNRMPDNGALLCDGGTVELCGCNLFNRNALPRFVLKGGSTLVLDCSLDGGHIVLNTLSLEGSDIVIRGEEEAWSGQALAMGALTAGGACGIRYAENAYTNKFHPSAVEVRAGGELDVAVKAFAFAKTGPGALAACAGSEFDGLSVGGGVLKIPAASGTFAALSMTNGTTLDLTADRSVLRVDGAMTIAADDTVSVDIGGRAFFGEEPDENGRRYIIRWRRPPEGTLAPVGREGCRIVKLDDGAVLKRIGTIIILR